MEAIARRDGAKRDRQISSTEETCWHFLGSRIQILTRVYTGAVRPAMEYASTSWSTAAKTNISRLDKVQNMGLRLILGAMKTTPVKDMEKTADIEPLERRRDLKILFQGEKMKRLPTHQLHSRLEQPTKNRLKRTSLNHKYKGLSTVHKEVLQTGEETPNPLPLPEWRPDDEADITISLTVPGITSKDQAETALKNLTLAMIEDSYPAGTWTHVYTDGSAEKATHNGGSGVHIQYTDGDNSNFAVPGGQLCSNYRAEVLTITTAANFLTSSEKPLGKVSIFTDSMSTLQALDSSDRNPLIRTLKDSLSSLSKIVPITLHWIPAHVGIPGNEQADKLAKEGSQLPQQPVPSTYEEAKTILRAKFNKDWATENNGYQARRDPIRFLERQHQTSIYRLRTGHCCLRSHLHRIGVKQSPLCECGVNQTPYHILQDCPLLQAERLRVWPVATDVETKLQGTVDDLNRTVQFLTSTELKF